IRLPITRIPPPSDQETNTWLPMITNPINMLRIAGSIESGSPAPKYEHDHSNAYLADEPKLSQRDKTRRSRCRARCRETRAPIWLHPGPARWPASDFPRIFADRGA